jgi:hypothetical protein
LGPYDFKPTKLKIAINSYLGETGILVNSWIGN